jgi:uncharacterized membrane-anchored protein
MALWVGSMGIEAARGTDVVLPIRGFDPIDILRGHYLTYQVDYGTRVKIQQGYDMIPRCVCLEAKGEGRAEASWFGQCADRDPATCPLFIKGNISYGFGGFNAGIERYYIPEAYSEKLRVAPDGATIKVRVTSSGRGYVTDMFVNGEPILEYAKRQ